MSPSCVTSLAILQEHGLTPALLERFSAFCGQEKTGSFIFHTGPGGKILAYEEHHKSRVEVLERLAAMEEARESTRTRS